MANHLGAPQDVIDHHIEMVQNAANALREAETAVEKARATYRKAIQNAFKDKVKVGPLKEATGLSETRVYQLRDGI